MTAVLFYFFAAAAVATAILVVLFRNPVHSALSLVFTFFCIAGLFVLLEAFFLSAVLVIVYAGAIMVLFLFVIMLLNLGRRELLDASVGRFRWAFVVLLIVFLVVQIGMVARSQGWAMTSDLPPRSELQTDNTAYVGKALFTDYLLPFEIAALILTVALVGVMVLVKREKPPASG